MEQVKVNLTLEQEVWGKFISLRSLDPCGYGGSRERL